jgi:hypothetical protein
MQIQYQLGILARCLAALGLVFSGAISLSAEEKELSDSELKAWTDGRVTDGQPTAAQRRFDEIGWADSLSSARQLSRDSARPVFLFTLDGRLAIGRC